MTSFVYPTLQGLTYDVTRYYVWHTEVQSALSGKRSTLAYMQYPLVHFELVYSILRDDQTPSDAKALMGLFNACQGSYDTFLFQDPDFNSFTSSNQQAFGTGDGTTTVFQLTAQYQNSGGPGTSEIIQNLNAVPVIYNNGVIVSSSAYNLGLGVGIVTFTTAPASGHALTWSGSFYYRCAFDDDKLEFVKFMKQWWVVKKVSFTTVKI
jgi:uncharacterized protein (TIGR02217 family)